MKEIFLVLLLALSLSSCAHDKPRTAETERGDYAAQADNRLNDFTKRAQAMKPEKAATFRAQIADARAELSNLKSASIENWEAHRAQVDSRLTRLQSSF